jgi:hypothetical protein
MATVAGALQLSGLYSIAPCASYNPFRRQLSTQYCPIAFPECCRLNESASSFNSAGIVGHVLRWYPSMLFGEKEMQRYRS